MELYEGKELKIVALASGGIDSFLMMHILKKRLYEIFPIFINYGQLGKTREWISYKRICEYLNLKPYRISIPEYGKYIESGITNKKLDITKFAFLPNRNLLFITLASAYAYQNDIYVVSIGLLNNPIFPDQTKKFINYAEKCIKESLGVDFKIIAPLIDLDKIDIYNLAKKFNLPIEIVYYCHAGEEKPCGNCLACKEHILTREKLGI